jgi:hypothetical protein
MIGLRTIFILCQLHQKQNPISIVNDVSIHEERRSEDDDTTKDEDCDYIFRFGSIMNTTTHAPWLQTSGSSPHEKVAPLPGAVVTLKKTFGYARH